MFLLIPAYNPVPSLPDVVSQLHATKVFQTIIVVNDGSNAECDAIFARLQAIPDVTVLTHSENSGKGAALKTGFGAAIQAGCTDGVVTADADGQHSVEDIVRVAKALAEHPASLILGARSFGTDVPLRSRFGNILTRNLMRLITGQAISDTQTGLRGIPAALLPALLELTTSGYEFELDMLMHCRGRHTIREIPIETIYIDGNATSHFNPILDSMRIYMVLARFIFASVISAVVDNVLFVICFFFWPNIAGCQVVGRVGSLFLNYSLNRSKVFQSTDDMTASMLKYLALVVLSGTLSYGIIRLLAASGMNVVVAKLLAETVLFFFNFVIQRKFVFRPARA